MELPATRWTRLVGSGRVTDRTCHVWGFIVSPGSSGESAVVYDGLDSGTGRLFATLRCALHGSTPYLFGKAVQFDSGVYVTFAGNIDEVTVIWEPVP